MSTITKTVSGEVARFELVPKDRSTSYVHENQTFLQFMIITPILEKPISITIDDLVHVLLDNNTQYIILASIQRNKLWLNIYSVKTLSL